MMGCGRSARTRKAPQVFAPWGRCTLRWRVQSWAGVTLHGIYWAPMDLTPAALHAAVAARALPITTALDKYPWVSPWFVARQLRALAGNDHNISFQNFVENLHASIPLG